MLIRVLLLAAMIVYWSAPVFGEYYQYRDGNGVLRFTDDINRVPPDQRFKVKSYSSIESQPVPATNQTSDRGDDGDSNIAEKAETQIVDDASYDKNNHVLKELKQMRAELTQTRQDILAEQAGLKSKAPTENASYKQKADYNIKVDALNAKITNYQTQLKNYNQKLSEYNAQFNK